MLEAAGLQAPTPEGVPGDGACAYWSLLATMDGGLPRTTFAPGWQPLAGRAADEAARAAMCQLRAQVVQWLLAPAQRRLLRIEPGCTRSFAQYAAGRLEGCDRRIRDELREQAGIPIGNAGDVVRPHEALSMLERCGRAAGRRCARGSPLILVGCHRPENECLDEDVRAVRPPSVESSADAFVCYVAPACDTVCTSRLCTLYRPVPAPVYR